MSNWFSELLGGRGAQRVGVVRADGAEAGIPTHWLDVTERKSSDQPPTLERLELSARVAGLHALVTQTLVIANPNRRPISASVAIPMPDGAVVCGYALEVDGQMVDGVVVKREQARVAFETEQRRGADPGLVEAVRGNLYRTRVYPVPAKGTRTISLRYTTPLVVEGGSAAVLDLPMPADAPQTCSLDIEVERLGDACAAPVVDGLGDAAMTEQAAVWTLHYQAEEVTADGPVRVTLPELPSSFVLMERDAEGDLWFVASERQELEPAAEPPALTALTVLWDASGSRADIDHAQELALLRAYAAAPSLERICLVSFAERVREQREFADVDALVAHLEALRYDGATSYTELARAVADLPQACAGAAQGSVCLLFSDGLDTLSEEPFELPVGCDALAIVSGAERDAEALRQACCGLAFDLAHAPKDAEALMRALDPTNPDRTLALRGTGVADVCTVGTPGCGRRSVIGRLTQDEVELALGEQASPFALRAEAARPGSALASAWAARRVTLLSPRASENAEELLRIGRRFGVASPVTSLLVLEELDQWLLYDIEPPKTWESMHSAWVRAHEGAMSLSDSEAQRQWHRASLVRSWDRTLQWWKRDYTAAPGGAASVAGFCPNCGQPYRTFEVHCPSCGARLPVSRGRDADRLGMRMSGMFLSDDQRRNLEEINCEPRRPRRTEAPQPIADALFEEEGFADCAPMDASFGAAAPMPAAEHLEMSSLRLSIDHVPEPEEEVPAATMAVSVRAWMPDARYLSVLDEAIAQGGEAARQAYFDQRSENRSSPSFFLDCAGWFIAHDDEDFGLSVLSNLAEFRIDDPALLRVMGWRLREAGRLEQALSALRRVREMRPEDSQSLRDVALVLDELARIALADGREDAARAYAEEAGELYREIALTPWARRSMAIGLFAVEEYNVLRAWAEAQTWECAPSLPSLGEDLEGVLDCDLRITLAWDADETDVDIHVTEPSGEEAYYAHQKTNRGGRVSEDITDGFGPELYEIRRAQKGSYLIRAHYYASHQQTIFGPATCTLTVYSDWGRPAQSRQVTTARLDNAKQMIEVGTASYGDAAAAEEPGEVELDPRGAAPRIEAGMEASALIELLGEPDERNVVEPYELWTYQRGVRALLIVLEDGKVTRASERMPWGDDMIIAQ